jgi:hypothetical protein
LGSAITTPRSPAVEISPRAFHGIGGDLSLVDASNTTNEVSEIWERGCLEFWLYIRSEVYQMFVSIWLSIVSFYTLSYLFVGGVRDFEILASVFAADTCYGMFPDNYLLDRCHFERSLEPDSNLLFIVRHSF